MKNRLATAWSITLGIGLGGCGRDPNLRDLRTGSPAAAAEVARTMSTTGSAMKREACDEPVSFSTDVEPFMQAQCLGCHTTANAAGGVALDDLSSQTDGSVWSRIGAALESGAMPPPSAEPRPDRAAVIRVAEWIAIGGWRKPGRPIAICRDPASETAAAGSSPVGTEATPAAGTGASCAEVISFDRHVEPFLKENCLTCHGAGATLGGFDVSALSSGEPSTELWARVEARLGDGTMPPVSMPAPSTEAVARVRTFIAAKAWTRADKSVAQDCEEGSKPEQASTQVAGTVPRLAGFACDPSRSAPQSPRVWRLTHDQYRAALRHAFPTGVDVKVEFPPDSGYGSKALFVGAGIADRYAAAALLVAQQAAPALMSGIGCDPVEGACLDAFLRGLGERLYRQPLMDEQLAALRKLYLLTGSSPEEAVRRVVMAMLQSPYFLYRLELGVGSGSTARLSAFEAATQLAFLLWDAPPDDALFAAARDGKLETKIEVLAQARRMLADDRARALMPRFFTQLLALDQAATAERDPLAFPSFAAARGRLGDAARAFVDHVMTDGDGRIKTLFTAPYWFADASVADLFGLSGVGSEAFVKIDGAASGRAGLLTQPAFTASYAGLTESSPMTRGRILRENLLCQPLAPPPADVEAKLPKLAPNATQRERFKAHSASPTCAACHDRIDDLGFAFENFDAVGAYRAKFPQAPIDASGHFRETYDAPKPFADALELQGLLSTSAHVRDCLTLQFFRYGFGRGNDPVGDACSVAPMRDALEASDGDLESLIEALVQSDAFTSRNR